MKRVLVAIWLLIAIPGLSWAKPSVSVQVNVEGEGSVTSSPLGINCPGECFSEYPKSTTVTLTAVADEGWSFIGWAGTCTGIAASCKLKLVKPATTTAIFQFGNLLPNAVDDLLTTDEDIAADGNVLFNDELGDAPATVTAYDIFSVFGGTVDMAVDGSFTFTPANGFFGTDSFDYTITDSNGDADSATVSVIVNEVLDPAPLYPAPVAQTGQVLCHDVDGYEVACDGTGHDGDTHAGVAWPVPRFIINGDGTVTDALTGLVWLRTLGCFGDYLNWPESLSVAENLADGQCDLTDGSVAGDWRVPNVKEALSLIDYQFYWPPISNAMGTGQMAEGDPFICAICPPGWLLNASWFWTSTTNVGTDSTGTDKAFLILLYSGETRSGNKSFVNHDASVWPVRDAK